MADLSERDSANTIKLVGASPSSGVETYYCDVTAGGRLQVDAEVDFPDTSIDAFHRLRVSDPVTLFDSTFVQGIPGVLWETITATGGTVTFSASESAASLTTTTSSGSSAILESHGYPHYHPGKSHLAICTGVLGTPTSGSVKRIGLFNESDGVFFEQDGTGTSVVIRSSASGSMVENRVYQTNWNIDKMNGSGLSGITADWSKTHIFIWTYQWLGVGSVVAALDINGQLYPVHRFNHANNETRVYMSTGSLPVRYEATNTGASAGTTLKAICCSVMSEGGVYDATGIVNGVDMGITTRSITARQAVLSVRLKTSYKTKTNRMTVVPLNVAVRSSSDIYWELILQHYHNGDVSLGGTPTWADVQTANSGLEYSVNVTTVGSLGRPLISGYTSGGAARDAIIVRELGSKAAFALNSAGTNSDVVHLVATSFSGSAQVSASINWREVV